MTEATHFSQCVHDQQRRLKLRTATASLGTRLSLRGRRVWPAAHTRLVLASYNYSGKLSGCAAMFSLGSHVQTAILREALLPA